MVVTSEALAVAESDWNVDSLRVQFSSVHHD